MDKQQNLFQQFFRNELVWLGTITLALWGFVVQVVLPIQRIQIELDQVQTSLAQVQGYDQRITENHDEIIKLQDQLSKK